MASTLVGNPLFSTPLWLEGSSLFPGVEVVSGPIDLKSLASSPVHSQFPQFPLASYNHPKCRPSQPLPEPDFTVLRSYFLLLLGMFLHRVFAPVLMGLQSAPIGFLMQPWVSIVNASKRNGKNTFSPLYMHIIHPLFQVFLTLHPSF